MHRLGGRGLYVALRRRGFRAAVVQVGGEDVAATGRPLSGEDLGMLELAVRGVCAVCRACPAAGVLVGGTMYRRDVGRWLVDESNFLIRRMVMALAKEGAKGASTFSVSWPGNMWN